MSVVEKQIKETLKEKQPTLDVFRVTYFICDLFCCLRPIIISQLLEPLIRANGTDSLRMAKSFYLDLHQQFKSWHYHWYDPGKGYKHRPEIQTGCVSHNLRYFCGSVFVWNVKQYAIVVMRRYVEIESCKNLPLDFRLRHIIGVTRVDDWLLNS